MIIVYSLMRISAASLQFRRSYSGGLIPVVLSRRSYPRGPKRGGREVEMTMMTIAIDKSRSLALIAASRAGPEVRIVRFRKTRSREQDRPAARCDTFTASSHSLLRGTSTYYWADRRRRRREGGLLSLSFSLSSSSSSHLLASSFHRHAELEFPSLSLLHVRRRTIQRGRK